MLKGTRVSSFVLTMTAVTMILAGCSGAPTATPTATPMAPTAPPTVAPAQAPPTPTPSPTPSSPAVLPPTPEPPRSPCAGLNGQIEVQVLVGPAEAVGLEPVAVGKVPFSVAGEKAPFTLQGGGTISYADVLVEKWGTYEVTLDLEASLSGECVDGPEGQALEVDLVLAGEQMVEVEAEGLQGEYPWAGSVNLDLTFPLVDGATAQGEGWVLVLHLLSASADQS